jgi:hypothetical protein
VEYRVVEIERVYYMHQRRRTEIFPLKLYTTIYLSFMRMSYENGICLLKFVFFFHLRNVIKSSLLYGSETWKLTENNKRRVETTEMDALRRSSRISRKERIRNITI